MESMTSVSSDDENLGSKMPDCSMPPPGISALEGVQVMQAQTCTVHIFDLSAETVKHAAS